MPMLDNRWWIVMTGDPVEGFTLFGVFSNSEAARDWADEHITDYAWWVVSVVPAED